MLNDTPLLEHMLAQRRAARRSGADISSAGEHHYAQASQLYDVLRTEVRANAHAVAQWLHIQECLHMRPPRPPAPRRCCGNNTATRRVVLEHAYCCAAHMKMPAFRSSAAMVHAAQVLHIQAFLHQAPHAPICAKALLRRAAARRVRPAARASRSRYNLAQLHLWRTLSCAAEALVMNTECRLVGAVVSTLA